MQSFVLGRSRWAESLQSYRTVRACLGALLALLMAFPIPAFGIAGMEGTFEFGLDAPWRMEPSEKSDGNLEYGAIPIQISIHDARHTKLDNITYTPAAGVGSTITVNVLPNSRLSLGRFRAVRIKELGPTEMAAVDFPLRSLHELEFTTGDWPWPVGPSNQPFHKVCRIWNGEDPEPFREVAETSEWHATLYYSPKNRDPGTVVALQIEVLLERQRTVLGFPITEVITLRNYARVYLSPAPLPRFDNRWLYGDLHYHSQGTDNEGESAYNYRGVVRAMGAMGMDFVFAVDHASSSEQIVDADLPPVHKIAEVAHSHGDKLFESDARATGGVARDLNAFRYAFCHELIYGAGGVNSEATLRAGSRRPQNFLSYDVFPQIFLGGEIDAVGEVSLATVKANTIQTVAGPVIVNIPYGNGLKFELGTLCAPGGCNDPRQSLLTIGDAESALVNDFQSLESFQFFGRQHLVYFPNTSAPTVGNESAFIPSQTSRFGGATRRLDSAFSVSGSTGQPLLPEVERKGVVFIAHHLNASSGGRGPDSVPWTTDHMLLKGFRSPAVLGLEFWNEDVRFRTRVCSHDFCRPNGGDLGTFLGQERGYERNEKLQASSANPLEDLLVFVVEGITGLDLVPEEFHKIALPLEEARRGFTGDRLFELVPFDLRTGAWQLNTGATEHTLIHGAFDWDVMNLTGLDFENKARLAWLQPGEPRRFFMGGGSDAHGDLNYRRAGYFLGTDDANDTAIGKPRNLVFAGAPEGPVILTLDPPITRDPGGPITTPGPIGPRRIRAHSHEQMVRALRGGQFCVTDGPALRMAIDLNGNGQIDETDIQMGGIHSFAPRTDRSAPAVRGQKLTLLTEVISTPEFGGILDIDVYVGVHPAPTSAGSTVKVEPRVYAPLDHGPTHGLGAKGSAFSYESNGRNYVRRTDNYWDGQFLGDIVTWNHVPGASLRFSHTLVTTLDLDKYQVGQGIPADRFFVRAFARTGGGTHEPVAQRYAYGNPIWLRRNAPVSGLETGGGSNNPSEPAPPIGPPSRLPTVRAAVTPQGEVSITFEGICTFSPRLDGPFVDIVGAVSPYIAPKGQAGFFRARTP